MRHHSTLFVAIAALTLAFAVSCAKNELTAGGAAATESTDKDLVDPTLDKPVYDVEPTGDLQCLNPKTTASAGKSVAIAVGGTSANTQVTVRDGLGSASLNSAGDVLTYTAATSVSQQTTVVIDLTDGGATASCEVSVSYNGQLLMIDDGSSRALLAYAYKVTQPAADMSKHQINGAPNPDHLVLTNKGLDSYTKLGNTYMVSNIEVSTQQGAWGFPGAEELTQFFGIRYFGKINIPKAGTYGFRFTNLDDGAVLYIDGKRILNNDGCASENDWIKKPSTTIELTAGAHDIRVDYYQGIIVVLGVKLEWQKPSSNWEVVPSSVFSRP
jgi:hypothetical protein